MDIQQAFAANVRKYRKAARLSQEKLAELAGLHRTYVGGIEQRRVNVSLKNIGKIATALDVDPAVLFLSDESVEAREVVERKARVSRMPKEAPAGFSSGRTAGSVKGDAAESAATSSMAGSSDGKPDYALVCWNGGTMTMRPLEVPYEDLTIQVLCSLAAQGYEGEELIEQYRRVNYKVISFLDDAT